MTRGIENSAVINNVKLFKKIINRSHVLLHRFFPLNVQCENVHMDMQKLCE